MSLKIWGHTGGFHDAVLLNVGQPHAIEWHSSSPRIPHATFGSSIALP